MTTDADLYLRGAETLVASWQAYARGAAGASMRRSAGVAARRRGLATALTARQAHDAGARGCQTPSPQSTAMAERVYAAVGFRDLGRLLAYVPSASASAVRGSCTVPAGGIRV